MAPDRAHRAGEDGFSLLELLIVMVVVALLMAIAVPTFLSQKATARQQAMIGAAEQVAAGLGRMNEDFPAINGTDPLVYAAHASARRSTVCSSGNPLCKATDQGLFTRSGSPAVKAWPDSPYGGRVVLQRVRRGGSCDVSMPPGTVGVCRVGIDGFRVVAWGRTRDGRAARVYDKRFL